MLTDNGNCCIFTTAKLEYTTDQPIFVSILYSLYNILHHQLCILYVSITLLSPLYLFRFSNGTILKKHMVQKTDLKSMQQYNYFRGMQLDIQSISLTTVFNTAAAINAAYCCQSFPPDPPPPLPPAPRVPDPEVPSL